MRAFLNSLDDNVWMSIVDGWVKLDNLLAKWDKIMHALSNANNKALNVIFFAISSDEFHKVSFTNEA